MAFQIDRRQYIYTEILLSELSAKICSFIDFVVDDIDKAGDPMRKAIMLIASHSSENFNWRILKMQVASFIARQQHKINWHFAHYFTKHDVDILIIEAEKSQKMNYFSDRAIDKMTQSMPMPSFVR